MLSFRLICQPQKLCRAGKRRFRDHAAADESGQLLSSAAVIQMQNARVCSFMLHAFFNRKFCVSHRGDLRQMGHAEHLPPFAIPPRA